MAGPFDSIMKRMIGLHPEDFVQWLDAEATFEQALDIELKSQHIFADALLKITKKGKAALKHLECQTGSVQKEVQHVSRYSSRVMGLSRGRTRVF